MSLFKAVAPAALLAATVVLGAPALAQTTASVTVTAGTSLATIPASAFGLNTAVWDGNLTDSVIPSLLYNAGITALRYPGGSTSDTYNWQTNSIVPGLGGYANPNNGFDAFMTVANKAGASPIITINYGSGSTGSGGGTPAFAAQWVQYANITKAYGVKYWEIGNEVYGNAEYGGNWETDLHTAHDPSTYGTNVAAFVTAMKAVDPTIKVGAVIAAPGNWPDGVSPDWNSNVLAKCGSVIDFVIVHWYPQAPGWESDAGLLAAPQSGVSGNGPNIATMMTKVKALIAQYGGANASKIQILVTETNSVASNEGKQSVSLVNAMFLADDVTTWLENGAANVDVWDLQNGGNTGGNNSSSLYGNTSYGDYGLISSGNDGEPAADTPLPPYYGIQMLSKLGKAGDTLVSSSSSNSLLTVHAVKQAGGNLALLLINKDPSNTTTATVSLAGFTPAATGTSYTFGKTSSVIGSASVSGLGTSFQVSAAPYSLTTIVLTPSSGTVTPSYTVAASPSSLSLAQGASGAATIAVAPSGGFTSAVSFAVSGVPSGVTASFSPASTTGSTTLNFSVGSAAKAGTSVMTVTGTSGSLSATTTVALTVTATPTPGFTLSDSPGSLALAAGGSATSAITIARTGGFTGAVSLATSGLPAGVTASLSTASTTGASSTLTLTAASGMATATGSIVVTGTSGSLIKTVTLPVTISGPSGGGGNGAGGGKASVAGVVAQNSAWFDEDNVVLTTSTPITAMTLTIMVPTTNVQYGSQWNSVGSQIVQSHATGPKIAYGFALASGQTMRAGSYTFAAQMSGNGKAHAASGDSWIMTYTAGGVTSTVSGSFSQSSAAAKAAVASRAVASRR
jgi:hypothetical protein